jgi:hypothetical protein
MLDDRVKLAIACLALFAGVVALWPEAAIRTPEGELAPRSPLQEPVAGPPWSFQGYELTPRARFALEARVLSAERYRWDAGARLAPVDLALGWGPMSDVRLVSRFRVTQGSRFYTLYPQDPSIDVGQALVHSGNMHLIPATAAVRRVLESARAGHVVRLEGKLVDVSRSDGFEWRTSLRRDDTGAGACELFWVESASRL